MSPAFLVDVPTPDKGGGDGGTTNPPPAVGDFGLTLSSTTLSVVQGGTTTLTASVARTGSFTGTVDISAEGLPAGVTASFNPSTVGAGVTSTVLTVTAAASVAPGNYTFGFCGTGDVPIWVAAQDGSGAWERVVGVNDSYSFTITTKRGIAYVTQNGANDFDINFYFGSVAEMQSRRGTICPTAATRTVNGTVANMGTSTQAMVTVGGGAASVLMPATTFQVSGVRSGAVDLVASRLGIDLANPAAGFQVNKMIIRLGISPADGSTLPVWDFNAAEAFNPATRTVTINGGAGGEQLAAGAVYFTAAGGSATMGTGLATGNTANSASVPAGNQLATDLHVISGFGTTVGAGASTSSRILTEVFKDAVNRTMTLPSALSTPTFTTLATAPYLRNRVQLTRQAEYDKTWVLGYGQTGRSVAVFISSGYLGADPFDFAFPDFSAVAGWQNSWGLAGGATTTCTVSASGRTLGGTGADWRPQGREPRAPVPHRTAGSRRGRPSSFIACAAPPRSGASRTRQGSLGTTRAQVRASRP